MSIIVDLSGPLFNGMWTYNDLPTLAKRLPEFEAERVTTVAEVGFESFRYVLSSTSGTYLETGAHMLDGVRQLSDLDVSEFIKPAVVCHVPRKGTRELIRLAELRTNCPPVREGDALLIECGWASHWQSPDFVTGGPSFHHDCLPWLMEQPMSLLGVDVPSIEPYWSTAEAGVTEGNMLIPLFQKGILLLGPLVNLDMVRTPRGELVALPLKVDGVSGAPCRAIFRPL
jgi:kynurenine formamidase